jgi:hypothetical protein
VTISYHSPAELERIHRLLTKGGDAGLGEVDAEAGALTV